MNDKLHYMFYGDSKTGKSSQMGLTAAYCYQKTGKPVRYISADNGGWRPIQGLVNAGIIEPITLIGFPVTELWILLRKLSVGYWPKEIDGDRRIVGAKVNMDGLDKVGGYLFEGLTSIAERMLEGFSGRKLDQGMKPAISVKEKLDPSDSEFETLGTSAQDHYGQVQREMINALIRSCSLPVQMVGWSAHESKGKEDVTDRPILGPAIVGNKGTPKVGKNIGLLMHFDIENVTTKVDGRPVAGVEYRAYFQPHPDSEVGTLNYKAGSRVPLEKVPELLKKYPGGYVPLETDKGLDEYLRFEDGLLEGSTNKWAEWKEKVDNVKRP